MYRHLIVTPTYCMFFRIIIIIIIIVMVFCVMLDKAVVNPALHFLFKERTIYYTLYKSCKTKCIPQEFLCHLCWLGKNEYLHYRYSLDRFWNSSGTAAVSAHVLAVTVDKTWQRVHAATVHFKTLHSLPVSDFFFRCFKSKTSPESEHNESANLLSYCSAHSCRRSDRLPCGEFVGQCKQQNKI